MQTDTVVPVYSPAADRLKSLYWKGAAATQPLAVVNLAAIVGGEVKFGSLGAIQGFTTLDRPQSGYAFFLDRPRPGGEDHLQAAASANMLLIGPRDEPISYKGPYAGVPHVRAGAAALIAALFPDRLAVQQQAIHPSAMIDPTASLSVGVSIGADSTVGPRTLILPNVTIGPNVRIGADCLVKSGTVIGQPGFGYYKSDAGLPRHLPHVGGVVIGDHVHLGALNTVASGTIHPTVIADHVKTDDHVHVAHNCLIGRGALITACAELSGSVTVGEQVWIGPNAAIRDGVEIGDEAFIVMGSVVTKSVPARGRVFGNPAKPMKQQDER